MNSLGEDVAVIIDGGPRPKPHESEPNEDGVTVGTEREPAPSTILDCTSFPYVVVREGAIPVEELREVVPSILTRAEADEQAARKVEEAQAPTQNESGASGASQQALDLSVIQQDTALRHLQVHILIRMDFEELFHGHGESLLPVAP